MTNEGKTAERCEIVVDSHAVEMHSQRGYRTLEIREEDISTTQFVNNQEVLPGSNYTTQVSKQVPVTLKVLRFHMVRSGESRIAELSATLEASQSECEALKKKVVEGDKVIAVLRLEVERIGSRADQNLVDLANKQKLLAELASSLRKMEETVAKIRKEIGEQRWRDITYDPSDQKMVEGEKARIVALDLDHVDVQTGSRS